MATAYKFGIEEELFLADAVTHGNPREVEAFHKAVHDRMPKAERELLEAQVEIMAPPCTDFAAARDALSSQRMALAEIGRQHGVLVLASGTHPTAKWQGQGRTKKKRYEEITENMQMLARRDIVCGMHVHVEVPNPDNRVDLMNRLMPFTPTLFALSASSPFWQGIDTGLNAYRLSVWGEMPRTGLPELFADAAAYERFVSAMVRSGSIKDASFLWWTLRPSIRYPTLELRVADSCTRVEDTLAIAALYRCFIRRVDRDPSLNRGITNVARAITSENMWRAQRRGVHASFIDEVGNVTPFASHLDLILEDLVEDIDCLGCESEIARLRTIAKEGTSADWQLAVFAEARRRGGSTESALAAVINWIASTTASSETGGEGA